MAKQREFDDEPLELSDKEHAELRKLICVGLYGEDEIPPGQAVYAMPARIRLLPESFTFKRHVSNIRLAVELPEDGVKPFMVADVDGIPKSWNKRRGETIEAESIALWWLDIHRTKAKAEKLGLSPLDMTVEQELGEEAERFSEEVQHQKALPTDIPPGTPSWFLDYLSTPECLPSATLVPSWLRVSPRLRREVPYLPESPFDDFVLRLAEVYHLPVKTKGILGRLILAVLTGDFRDLRYDNALEHTINYDRMGRFTITIKGDYHTALEDIQCLINHEIRPILLGHLRARGRQLAGRLPARRPTFELDAYMKFHEIVRHKGYSVNQILDAVTILEAGGRVRDSILGEFVRENGNSLHLSRNRLYQILKQLDYLVMPANGTVKGMKPEEV